MLTIGGGKSFLNPHNTGVGFGFRGFYLFQSVKERARDDFKVMAYDQVRVHEGSQVFVIHMLMAAD